MDESPDHGRRQYLSGLAAGAAAATAGCLLWDQTGATDLILYSLAAETTAVSVVITSDGATEPHTSRTLEVAQGENVDPVNDGKLPTNTGYTVEVAVEGGTTETFEWSDPDLEFAPLYVVVESPQSVEFLFHAG
jgi:hypothetical protein